MEISTSGQWWAEDDPKDRGTSAQSATLLRMYGPAAEPQAGSLRSDALEVDSHWHYHDMHQLMCAFEASIELEVEGGKHCVPRNLAAWIPAGVKHRVKLRKVRSTSIFLPQAAVQVSRDGARAIVVSSLMREMLLEASRWPLHGAESHTRDAFFMCFAALCSEWIENEADLFVPTSADPRIARALAATSMRMRDRVSDICRLAGMSERTFRRRLKQETGLTWEAFRHRSRLVKAITLLGETNRSILEIAELCGFESQSSFARAFKSTLHESPSEYRRRLIA